MAAAVCVACFSSARDSGEYNVCTCPILRPASITTAPGLIPAALSKYTWYVTSGRNNPGAPSNTRRNAITPIVPTTSKPGRVSFLSNRIGCAFQNRAFSAAAQELCAHWVFGLFKFFGFAFFNNLSFVQHSHSGGDAKGALHFVCHRD